MILLLRADPKPSSAVSRSEACLLDEFSRSARCMRAQGEDGLEGALDTRRLRPCVGRNVLALLAIQSGLTGVSRDVSGRQIAKLQPLARHAAAETKIGFRREPAAECDIQSLIGADVS